MTDLWLPDYLRQAQSSVHYIDATGASRGTFTGALRTNARGGDRLGATIRFTPHGGPVTVEASNRAILRSFLASLRGKQKPCLPFRRQLPASRLDADGRTAGQQHFCKRHCQLEHR
jgi:hypothetical protein